MSVSATPVTYTYLAAATPTPTELDENFATQVNDCLIPVADAYGYDLYVNSGFRSAADENAIYALGRTEDGNIVSDAKGGQSFHNFGFAVDMADHENGENIDYTELGRIGTWCGLEHGDRGYTDLPHFQYRDDLSLEEVQSGMRPKPLSLPCSLLKTRADAGATLTMTDLATCKAPDFSIATNLATPTTSATTDTTSTPPQGIPSTWIKYISNFGFSFWYPSNWVLDDSEIAQFASLHDATMSYSNLVIVATSSNAEADVTVGPSLTINVASLADEESFLHTNLASSAEWLNSASTGLPSKPLSAKVENLTVDGQPTVRLTNLSVVAGDYEATYLLENNNNAAIRFDSDYLNQTDLGTLDTIIQSFTMNENLANN